MKKVFKFIIKMTIFIVILTFLINIYVVLSVKNKIDNYGDDKDYDAIIVLGCGVWESGPSPMLKDRLDKAIELYKSKVAKKIIMSGDHGREDYDEVNAMKKYAIDSGVNSEDIFMDHAGFSTYESVYRARDIFGVKKAVIVTQKYHLFRALYISKSLGIKSYGASADYRKYVGRFFRETREVLARVKDTFKCVFKPKPTYLGQVISLDESGDITND